MKQDHDDEAWNNNGESKVNDCKVHEFIVAVTNASSVEAMKWYSIQPPPHRFGVRNNYFNFEKGHRSGMVLKAAATFRKYVRMLKWEGGNLLLW